MAERFEPRHTQRENTARTQRRCTGPFFVEAARPHLGRRAAASFSLADVSTSAMARFRQLAQRSGRLDDETLAESDANLLDKLRLKDGA